MSACHNSDGTPFQDSGTRSVYLAGYSGRKPEWLVAAVGTLNATCFDIRISPRSRRPEWSKKQLTILLGSNYQHVRGFGNLAYATGGPTQLADVEAGLAAFDAET